MNLDGQLMEVRHSLFLYFSFLVKTAIQDAQAHIKKVTNVTIVEDVLPSMSPNTAIINLHQVILYSAAIFCLTIFCFLFWFLMFCFSHTAFRLLKCPTNLLGPCITEQN